MNMDNSNSLSALVCASILLGAGCTSTTPANTSTTPANISTTPVKTTESPPIANRRNVFGFDGMPTREYYVGGGYVIRYIAKEDGTLIVANDTAKRLLATVSLQEGEKYENQFTVDNDETVIKLYFIPKSSF